MKWQIVILIYVNIIYSDNSIYCQEAQNVNEDQITLQVGKNQWQFDKIRKSYKEYITDFSYQYLIEYSHQESNKFVLTDSICNYLGTQNSINYDTYEEWKTPKYFKLDSLVFENCLAIINNRGELYLEIYKTLNNKYIVNGYKYSALNIKSELEQGYVVFSEDQNNKEIRIDEGWVYLVIEEVYYKHHPEKRSNAIKLNLVIKSDDH